MNGSGLPSASMFSGGLVPAPTVRRQLPVKDIELIRSQQPGGELLGYVQSRNITWWERTFRVLAPRGIYTATPSNPVNFTMGSYRLSQGQVLIVVDYAFDIYVFSGISPDDYVPIEPPSRLSTQVMWDIKVDTQRPGQNMQHQVIPKEQTQTQQAFAPNNPLAPAEQWQFDAVRASEQQGPGGAALAGMPQRRFRPGRVQIANQYEVRSGSSVVAECAVINPIPVPVVFFEVSLAGILMAQNDYDSYQAANLPSGTPQVPVLLPQTQDPQ